MPRDVSYARSVVEDVLDLCASMKPPLVTVDAAKCQATGYCIRIAPAAFKLEGTGPARFEPGPRADIDPEALAEAEDTCPTRAITVTHARV